jgi:hypothetical protein
MSVPEIKEAVQQLRLAERAEVAACLHFWSDDEWDEKMKRDLASLRFCAPFPLSHGFKNSGQISSPIRGNSFR